MSVTGSSPGPPHGPDSSAPGQRRPLQLLSVIAAVIAVIVALGVGVWTFILTPAPDPDAAPAPPATAIPPEPTVQRSPTVTPSSAPSSTPSRAPSATPSVTPRATPSPTSSIPSPTATPAEFPEGSQPCSDAFGEIDGFRASAAGNGVTSCPFAEEVRRAYATQPERNATVTVEVLSTVTNQTYEMTCTGERLVTCSGGNNAVVHLL